MEAPALDPARLQTRFWRYSPPTRFDARYRAALRGAENVRVILNATATELRTAPNGRHVDEVVVESLGGGATRVRARKVVLALGGIGNAPNHHDSPRSRPRPGRDATTPARSRASSIEFLG